MSVRVGLWSVCNGWLLVDGARWYGVWVGGLLVVVGWGGRGWVLCRLGVRASLWVVWVLCVCAVWPLRFLTGNRKKKRKKQKQKQKTSKKKTKIRGGGRGTQPPMAHAHRTQHAHR